MHERRAEYESHVRGWERRAPWFRRISARTGLQGKLVLSFMFLLVITLGAASIQFMLESRQMTAEVLGAKAETIAGTIAVGAEPALARGDRGDRGDLAALGRKVLRDRDIVGLAFFSAAGELLTSSWQDGDPQGLRARLVHNPRTNPDQAYAARAHTDAALGPYVEASAPVRVPANPDGTGPARVLGFVTVCLSQGDHAWRVGQSQLIVVLIGAVSALVSLPLVYMLVHRIFHPIRALVDATNRIACGDLETEVAIHRPDVIGTLARSFNEMVKKVRRQQQQLAATNEQLAAANGQLEEANAQLARANYDLARANESLGEANRGLEEKVRQRTAQVEAANDRLRREVAEKEDFLRAVSHDLNAPLRNIAGMATMLLMKNREKFDEDVIHRLERIQKNVQVETDLIAELLELSRIKTRRQKVERVDVGALVAEVGGLFEDDLRSRQISLILETPLPVVECEPARLRQVFQNLIDNAIKYMGDAGGEPGADQAAAAAAAATPGDRPREVRVGCTVRKEGAEFYVRDTGIGIEPEDLDKVFFIFRRGKSPTVQGVSGKGVGLASVKSIVETYEGTIWVRSELGKGSTFRFTIDAKFVPAAQELAKAAAVAAVTPRAA
jgi:signal transduction histidine kinase